MIETKITEIGGSIKEMYMRTMFGYTILGAMAESKLYLLEVLR